MCTCIMCWICANTNAHTHTHTQMYIPPLYYSYPSARADTEIYRSLSAQ